MQSLGTVQTQQTQFKMDLGQFKYRMWASSIFDEIRALIGIKS